MHRIVLDYYSLPLTNAEVKHIGMHTLFSYVRKAETSAKTVAATAKTDRLDLRVLKAASSAMYTHDHPRFQAMTWVKCHIIEGFCPLSHGEKEWVRACLKMTALKNFPITGIHNKAVKQMIIEMYAATASQFKREMAAEIGAMPLLHLNLDLWVDKFSSLKYIGKKKSFECRDFCCCSWVSIPLPRHVFRRLEKTGK